MVICKREDAHFEFMSLEKIHFIGLLANTDSSLEKLKLEHRFKIESFSDEEGYEFFSNLYSLPKIAVSRKFISFPCLNINEKKIYFISNSITNRIEINNVEKPAIFSSEIVEFECKLINVYLSNLFKLMRLFKEGNIYMPFYYYYYLKKDKPIQLIGHETTRPRTSELYTISDNELSVLQRFIKTTKILFEKPFLQLAFENLDLSYQIQEKHFSFLSLMMSLESLFQPQRKGKIRYRISHNTAILLWEKINKNLKTISDEVKDLYNKRCEIVHTGNKNAVIENDLVLLRYYVRESIKEIYKIGKNKDDLLDLLSIRGFSSSHP